MTISRYEIHDQQQENAVVPYRVSYSLFPKKKKIISVEKFVIVNYTVISLKHINRSHKPVNQKITEVNPEISTSTKT